jgi:ElaB/YqjD/DUF883 family membrane-anchored ribosome-binding protein
MAATTHRARAASKNARPRRRARRGARNNGLRSPARGLTARAFSNSTKGLSEVAQLVSVLQDGLGLLRGPSRALGEANDFVSGAVSDLTARARDNARDAGRDVTKYGNLALRQLSYTMDRHPLMALAVATGVGFLAGLALRNSYGNHAEPARRLSKRG